MNRLSFEAVYAAERLQIVNPRGDVGIVSLWSPLRALERKLREISPQLLDPEVSRVAVLSNLYGDGMYRMFCNILYNPQIRHLIAIGQDLGLPTCKEIEAFLSDGLEDAVMLGTAVKRVRGTARVFPAIPEFDESRLRGLSFRYFGNLSAANLDRDLVAYMRGLPCSPPASAPDRVLVRLPRSDPDASSYRPSEITSHQVVRRRPLDCWRELVVRGIRFGHPVVLRDGPRLELLNAKAVITEPAHESPQELERYGFRLERFLAYQDGILRPELPEGISYTYGNRLRGYFGRAPAGTDALQAVIDHLRDHPESRKAYISLWDTSADLPGPAGERDAAVPCLTTLSFRRTEGRLSLTATYRSHNLLTAWLENVYGLMAIQRHVAGAVDVPSGPITVVSHSLGIDPRSPRYELARAIARDWTRDDDIDPATGKPVLREDPNGYFIVTVDQDEGCIVAEHRLGGLLVKRYRSDRAATIEREICGDMAVSLVSHAMWLGRELARHEAILRGRGARSPRARDGRWRAGARDRGDGDHAQVVNDQLRGSP